MHLYVVESVRDIINVTTRPLPNFLLDMDEALFAAVVHNDKHVLIYIMPDRHNVSYSLRPKRHELTLAIKHDAN